MEFKKEETGTLKNRKLVWYAKSFRPNIYLYVEARTEIQMAEIERINGFVMQPSMLNFCDSPMGSREEDKYNYKNELSAA